MTHVHGAGCFTIFSELFEQQKSMSTSIFVGAGS